jgi:hypothetical protein
MRVTPLVLRSPWTYVEPLPKRECLTPKDVLVLPVDEAESAVLRESIRMARREFPAQSLAFWTESADPCHLLLMERLACSSGVRGVIWGSRPELDKLRSQLTSEIGMAEDVARWCVDTGVVGNPQLEFMVRDLIQASDRWSTLECACRSVGVCPRTLRYQFQQGEAPNPSKIFSLGFTLRVALRVQRNADDSFNRVAVEFRLSSRTVRRRLLRVLGLPPTQIREALGLEPLLHSWWSLAQDAD